MKHLKIEALNIYGCGGHAESVADVALHNRIGSLNFIDDNVCPDETLFGFKVTKTALNNHASHIVAIGDNQERARIYDQLQNAGLNLTALVAHTAYVGHNANIHTGVFVGHAAHIGPLAEIGANTIINTRSVIEHDCKIGKHGHISVNTTIAGKCQIGDFVMIGAGATVIHNVKICSHVTIGANAVVVRDITEPGTYVGVPARRI